MTKNSRNHRAFKNWRLSIAFTICTIVVVLPARALEESVPSDLDKARQLLHTPQLEKCISQAKLALAKHPDSAEWQQLMAQCLVIKNDPTAVKYAEKALSLKPTSSQIMATCSFVALENKNEARAFRLAAHAVRIDPSNGLAYAILALRENKLGRAQSALENFSRAIELSPADFDVNELAIGYYEARLDDRSVECADRLVANYPKSARAYFDRARLKRQEQDPAKALPDFNKAIALDPKSEARFYRAKLLQRLGRDKEAIVDFNQNIAVSPQSTGLYLRRSTSLLKIGQLKAALDDLNMGIRLANPPSLGNERKFLPKQASLGSKTYIFSWVQRMGVESRLGYQELALQDANEILRVDPACDAALAIRQDLLRKKGMNDKALADINTLLKINPDVADWYEARAQVYQKLNKPTEAASDLAIAKHIEEFGQLPSGAPNVK